MIVIEKGIPIPNKFPFKDMEVGDSFLIPENIPRTTVQVAAARYGKPLGKLFTIRKTPDGARCWRVQ